MLETLVPGPAGSWAMAVGLAAIVITTFWLKQHRSVVAEWSGTPRRFGYATDLRAAMVVTAAASLSAAVYFAERGSNAALGSAHLPPVLFLLDASRSMDVADLAPSRRDAATATLTTVVKNAPTFPAGLMIFAGEALLACPFTTDRWALQMALDDLPNAAAALPGGSALDLALTEAMAILQRTSRLGVVVLLSDGEHTTGEFEEIAAVAASAGIKIHVVGMGTITGGTMAVRRDTPVTLPDESATRVSRLNESGLQALAQATGGRYFPWNRVQAPAELGTLLSSSSSEATTGSWTSVEWLLLLVALAALIIELVLRRTWVSA